MSVNYFPIGDNLLVLNFSHIFCEFYSFLFLPVVLKTKPVVVGFSVVVDLQ